MINPLHRAWCHKASLNRSMPLKIASCHTFTLRQASILTTPIDPAELHFGLSRLARPFSVAAARVEQD